MAFKFKQFEISDDNSTMKVGTDAVLLGSIAPIDNIGNILDIGTGCGVVALMLAQRSSALIDAVEIDKASAIQAKENFDNSIWSERLLVHHSSIQNFIKKNNKRYDLVVSNPPYFINSLKSDNAMRNLARHADSLPFGELAHCVSMLLNDNGRFNIILPLAESDIFAEIALSYGLNCINKVLIRPKMNMQCNRILAQYQFAEHYLSTQSLIIRNDDDTYTSSYINLTKDFYLNF